MILLRRFLAGVGLLCGAVLFSFVAAASAEECPMGLVLLEAVRPGVPAAQNDWLYRQASPQRFTLHVGANRAYNPYTDEFKKVVKKEPEKCVSDHPFRAVAHLASKAYPFVLDQINEQSDGYDRLYFDLNGNGDLTDDKPIDALPPPGQNNQPKAEKQEGAAKKTEAKTAKPRNVNSWSYFPRVDIMLEVEGKDGKESFFSFYSFFFSVYEQGRSNTRYVMATLSPAAFRRGEINLDGKKWTVALLDHNSNGRFDDVLSVPDVPSRSKGRISANYGDVLLIVPPKAGKVVSRSRSSLQNQQQYLAKLVALDKKYYDVSVSPRGDSITWTPSTLPSGGIVSPDWPCQITLVNDRASINLNLEKSKPAEVPAGQWRMLAYQITVNDWQKPEEKSDGEAKPDSKQTKPSEGAKGKKSPPRTAPSYVMAYGTYENEPVEVRAEETTTLKIGPPYKLDVNVYHQPGTEMFSLSVVGVKGETVVGLMVDGRRPPKPEITITDPKGKAVVKGSFEYG